MCAGTGSSIVFCTDCSLHNGIRTSQLPPELMFCWHIYVFLRSADCQRTIVHVTFQYRLADLCLIISSFVFLIIQSFSVIKFKRRCCFLRCCSSESCSVNFCHSIVSINSLTCLFIHYLASLKRVLCQNSLKDV